MHQIEEEGSDITDRDYQWMGVAVVILMVAVIFLLGMWLE